MVIFLGLYAFAVTCVWLNAVAENIELHDEVNMQSKIISRLGSLK